jgi:hypothetical protein
MTMVPIFNLRESGLRGLARGPLICEQFYWVLHSQQGCSMLCHWMLWDYGTMDNETHYAESRCCDTRSLAWRRCIILPTPLKQ